MKYILTSIYILLTTGGLYCFKLEEIPYPYH